jgi:glycosyltransferase involved in cell wall biosynthesis
MGKVKVLVVGQVPPPYGGQAIMIQKLVEASYPDVEIFHVPMYFSPKMGEMGKFNFRKSMEVFAVVARILKARFAHQCTILYYVPTGLPVSGSFPLLQVVRDMAILLLTRWLFQKTIFHLHASGIGQIYDKFPAWLRPLFRRVYWHPDATIQLSVAGSKDSEMIHAKRTYSVPNGVEDMFPKFANRGVKSTPPIILYVGGLFACKGVLDLLNACKMMSDEGISFRLRFMGQGPLEIEKQMVEFIETNHLSGVVDLIGVKINDEKWHEFSAADILCFPTFCPFESFGLVLVEAMMFGLPIVSTLWDGIPKVVSDKVQAFLVPPQKLDLLAEKLRELVQNPDLRYSMGQKGRERFLQEFTVDIFRERLRQIFLAVADA